MVHGAGSILFGNDPVALRRNTVLECRDCPPFGKLVAVLQYASDSSGPLDVGLFDRQPAPEIKA
jgi:hypothetical protein